MSVGSRCELRDPRCELQDPHCESQDLRRELQGHRYELQGRRCELQGRRCELQGRRHRLYDLVLGAVRDWEAHRVEPGYWSAEMGRGVPRLRWQDADRWGPGRRGCSVGMVVELGGKS